MKIFIFGFMLFNHHLFAIELNQLSVRSNLIEKIPVQERVLKIDEQSYKEFTIGNDVFLIKLKGMQDSIEDLRGRCEQETLDTQRRKRVGLAVVSTKIAEKSRLFIEGLKYMCGMKPDQVEPKDMEVGIERKVKYKGKEYTQKAFYNLLQNSLNFSSEF